MFKKGLFLFICLVLGTFTVSAQDNGIVQNPTAVLAYTNYFGEVHRVELLSDGIVLKDTQITSGLFAWELQWSPDGKHIAFTANNCQLMMMDEFGGQLTALQPANICSAMGMWSPDSKQIAFYKAHVTPDDKTTLWVMNVDDTRERKVANDVAGCCLFWHGNNKLDFAPLFGYEGNDTGLMATLGEEIRIEKGHRQPFPDPLETPKWVPTAWTDEPETYFLSSDPTGTLTAVAVDGLQWNGKVGSVEYATMIFNSNHQLLSFLTDAQHPSWQPKP